MKQFFASLRSEFAGYNAARLGGDVMAGLTVCAVSLPLALAFGVSSGASAAAGLVTAIVAGVVIALLGGASYQVSGPTGAMSAVLVGIVARYGLQGVFLACFAAGALLLAAGLLRLGKLISFIPMPVIMGFTSGIALVIALGQVDNFFGTVSEGSTNLERLASYARLGFHPQWQPVLIGALVVAVMVLWPKKWGARVPGSLVGIVLATVVATAAIARTSVAVKSGQQTRLTSVFHAVFLLASMFLLGGVMARLPLAALAGVLMVTAWRMNDWEGIRYLLGHRFKSGISQFFITMVATVAADLTVAILVGIVYSALLYIVKASHINVSFSDIDASRLPGAPGGALPKAGVVYVTGSLFFGAVDEFSRLMAEMPDCREVIFSLRGMPSLAVSGAQALLELCTRLKEQGRGVAFCGVAPEVRLYFDRAGITALAGESAFFWSADQAIFALLEKERAAV